jgi:hypothetical protein
MGRKSTLRRLGRYGLTASHPRPVSPAWPAVQKAVGGPVRAAVQGDANVALPGQVDQVDHG